MGTRLQRAGDLAARASSLQPSDPSLRRGLHAGILLVVLLSVALAATTAVGDLPDVEWRYRPLSAALAVAAVVGSLLANAEIWRRLLRALGPELDPPRSRAIWCAAALGRYVPTSLLLPMLRVAMSERQGVPKRVCLASIVYETALYFVSVLLLSAYFVVDLPELGGGPARYGLLALPVAALALMHPRVFQVLANRGLRMLGRAELKLVLSERRVLGFAALYTASNVLAGLSLFWLAQLVYPVGPEDLVSVIGAYAVGTALAVVAFMLPGGLVAREVGITVALSPVMPAAPALAVAVLSRIVQLVVELALAVITPWLAARSAEAGPQRS